MTTVFAACLLKKSNNWVFEGPANCSAVSYCISNEVLSKKSASNQYELLYKFKVVAMITVRSKYINDLGISQTSPENSAINCLERLTVIPREVCHLGIPYIC